MSDTIGGLGMRDRARGALIGMLIGDALGSEVEFRSARSINEEFPDGVRRMTDGGTWGTLPGQPTDDGELTLALARSVVTEGTYRLCAVRCAYEEWARSDPFDMGFATRSALLEHSPDVLTQANGSLMRSVPLGILAAGAPASVRAWAAEDSAITHPHPVPTGAVLLYVSLIGRAIREGLLGTDALTAAKALCDDTVPAEVRRIVAAASVAAVPSPADGPASGWVLLALQNCLHRVSRAYDFAEALVGTIAMGGDTDTNGAILGGLMGACVGMSALPGEWVEAVLTCRPERIRGARRPRPEEYWPSDAVRLADALLDIGFAHG